MKRLFLIVLLIAFFMPARGYAQGMTCEEYLEMRQDDVDLLNETFDSADNLSGLFIFLYTIRHKYEDLDPPGCAVELNRLMIASISANQDAVGLSLARFSIDDYETEVERLGERIQHFRGLIADEMEQIDRN